MKWLIASDIHGNPVCCKKLLEAFDREKADRLLLLGDILYHGLGDGDKRAVADMLNGISDCITCVQGNCDSEQDMLMLDFPMADDYVTLYVGDKRVFATHGHLYTNTAPACAPRVLLQNSQLRRPTAKFLIALPAAVLSMLRCPSSRYRLRYFSWFRV